MLVGRPLAQVVSIYFDEAGGARSSHNPVIDCFAKELGKDRDDVEAQHVHEHRRFKCNCEGYAESPIKDLQIQQSFGRVDNDRLCCGINFDDYVSSHWNKILTPT